MVDVEYEQEIDRKRLSNKVYRFENNSSYPICTKTYGKTLKEIADDIRIKWINASKIPTVVEVYLVIEFKEKALVGDTKLMYVLIDNIEKLKETINLIEGNAVVQNAYLSASVADVNDIYHSYLEYIVKCKDYGTDTLIINNPFDLLNLNISYIKDNDISNIAYKIVALNNRGFFYKNTLDNHAKEEFIEYSSLYDYSTYNIRASEKQDVTMLNMCSKKIHLSDKFFTFIKRYSK